ncbi:UDP-glucose dehydrogenase family protein [Yoonia vestfoldensis]|uniref:UDP-glucose 6-dehydrogenase n=1 Tax=Yoonia vestfoldensis SKA53 TaxID=314232 RepID=A3V6A7_9RHOB|nr:UDP-glucose/GDP-mannose dehydrogenase family protein [Yoonia vestfoldensis]EAQ06431.1 UDP-glucose 6-dehydrogenase [Yoonia vestfoldensis SKA53]
MRIVVIGTGYVGLVSGVGLSHLGHDVVCVDNNATKIAMLRQGKVPIYEPGLQELLASNVEAGRLSFSTDLPSAVDGADVIFIAVGTPMKDDDGHADLSYVMAAVEEVAHALTGYAVIVTKSTVPVGTNRKIKQIIAQANPQAECDVASNPEFLRQGMAIDDFMRPDRIVVGVQTERAGNILDHMYSSLQLRNVPIITTDLESAELIKYASNAFLATKISFINEIAALCERVGADVEEVSKGMGLDERIGKKFLRAGPGYGGSCFPKDTRALANSGREHRAPQSIVETVIRVNDDVKQRMVEKLRMMCDGSFAGKIVTVFGVTFKPHTDDMRDASSLTIVPALLEGGAEVRVVDIIGRLQGEALLPGVVWHDDPYIAAHDADLVVVLTEWDEFYGLDLKKLARNMKSPHMADLHNIYSLRDAKCAGFEAYECVGQARLSQITDQAL